MASTTFVDGVLTLANRIVAAWLNDVNKNTYGVATKAALTALTTLDGALTVTTKGYYSAGDGGSGTYAWDATSVETANGGTILARDSGGIGRWKLLFSDTVSVLQFGMGLTQTAAVNTAAFNTCVEAAFLQHFVVTFPVSDGATGFSVNELLFGHTGITVWFNHSILNYAGTGSCISSSLESVTDYPQDITMDSPFIVLTGAGAIGINFRNSNSRIIAPQISLRAANQIGIRFGESSNVGNRVYWSTVYQPFIVGNASTQTGIFFYQTAQLGPNSNCIFGGRISGGIGKGIRLTGSGNNIIGTTLEGFPSGGTAVEIVNVAGASGVGSDANHIITGYMEGDPGANGFTLDAFTTNNYVMAVSASGFAAPGVFYPISDATVNANGNKFVGNDGAGPVTRGYRFANLSSTDKTVLDWYLEKADYIAAPTSLTIVGTPTYTFHGTRVGNTFKWWLRVVSTTTTASTAGTTYFTVTGMPTPVQTSTLTAVNSATVAPYGVGLIGTDSKLYMPTWPAVADVTVSGEFEVAT